MGDFEEYIKYLEEEDNDTPEMQSKKQAVQEKVDEVLSKYRLADPRECDKCGE